MKFSIFLVFSILMVDCLKVPIKRRRLQPKIDAGENAETGRFPYHVAINYQKKLLGSGSLIAADWILTVRIERINEQQFQEINLSIQSARVIYGSEKRLLWLRVTTDLKNQRKLQGELCSKDYFIHPKFKPKIEGLGRNFNNDIALIQAQQELTGSRIVRAVPKNVYPIKIPDRKEWPKPECQLGEIAGYGKQNLLQWTTVEISTASEVNSNLFTIL